MTTLDPLTVQFAHLFQRVDAASPTDPTLRAAATHWAEKRRGKLMPSREDMRDLPAFILPHVFFVHLAINGDARWLVSTAGSSARTALGLVGHEPQETPDKRMAARLRALCGLVSDRGEPYAVMFEMDDDNGKKQMVEIYAALLAVPEDVDKQIFAAMNSQVEQQS
jgi:hypothetical protein